MPLISITLKVIALTMQFKTGKLNFNSQNFVLIFAGKGNQHGQHPNYLPHYWHASGQPHQNAAGENWHFGEGFQLRGQNTQQQTMSRNQADLGRGGWDAVQRKGVQEIQDGRISMENFCWGVLLKYLFSRKLLRFERLVSNEYVYIFNVKRILVKKMPFTLMFI